MKVKMYYFRYPNFASRFIGGFFSFCTNLAFPIVTCYLIEIFLSLFGVSKYLNVEIYTALILVSIAIGLFFALKYCFSFKGITLYDSYLEITTQTLGFGKNKPSITINYNDISSVYHSTYNIRYDRRKARKSFIAGDYSDYVELTLDGGKQFCFSVDNQTDFLEELRSQVTK